MKILPKLAIVLILAIALLMPAGHSAQAAEAWDVPLAVSSTIGSADVTFGANSLATDGFDGYDVPAPMPPMKGVEAYFYYPDNPEYKRKLATSIVAPADSIIWPLKVKYITEGEAGEVTIGWESSDIDDVPSEYVTLELEDETGNKLADMRTEASYSFTADPNVLYSFQIKAATQITYDLTVGSTAGGSVTEPGEDTFTYDAGTVVDLLAVPIAGYDFVNWTGEVGDIDDVDAADTFITMNGHYSITANFALIQYDLTVGSTAGGSVTEPGEDTFTYDAGTVVNLVAVPLEGYAFGWWSGDVVADTNAASTTITMDSAKSIVANFVEFSAPENVSVTEMDPGVESITVTIEPIEELDVPAGIDPQEAYVVEPTGTGSFTLVFTDVSNASDIRVYKVVDGTWTLLEVTVVDATTIEVTMEVGDPILVFALPPATIATITLPTGWNLLSTPIKLDADSDALEQILGESLANIESSYRWDIQSQQWEIPTAYELSPLEAVYLKVKLDASATAEIVPSREVSELPSRELQRGLNLIGSAPAFDLEAGVFPAKPLNQALFCIAEAEGGLRGYTMVVSPAHNQPGWDYAPGGQIQDLLPFEGYWVVMENADTMYGSSTTPVYP